MTLKFEFRVLDENDNCLVSDWTHFSPASIDINGAVDAIDIHTGSALRLIRVKHLTDKLKEVA